MEESQERSSSPKSDKKEQEHDFCSYDMSGTDVLRKTIIKGFKMAQDLFAGQDTTKTPRTDYTNLIHNGKKYDTLEVMVHQIARERSNVAFKSTKLILAELGSKATDQKIADAMINANIKMIMSYIKEKADSRGLFGL